MQFWSHNSIQMYPLGSNCCQSKTLNGAVLRISENLRSKGQDHPMIKYRKNSKDQKSWSQDQERYNRMSWNSQLYLLTTKEVSGGSVCNIVNLQAEALYRCLSIEFCSVECCFCSYNLCLDYWTSVINGVSACAGKSWPCPEPVSTRTSTIRRAWASSSSVTPSQNLRKSPQSQTPISQLLLPATHFQKPT